MYIKESSASHASTPEEWADMQDENVYCLERYIHDQRHRYERPGREAAARGRGRSGGQDGAEAGGLLAMSRRRGRRSRAEAGIAASGPRPKVVVCQAQARDRREDQVENFQFYSKTVLDDCMLSSPGIWSKGMLGSTSAQASTQASASPNLSTRHRGSYKCGLWGEGASPIPGLCLTDDDLRARA